MHESDRYVGFMMAYFRGPLIRAAVIITCIGATSVSNAQSVTLTFSTPQRQFTVSAYQLPGAASRPAVLIMSGAKGYKAAEYSRLAVSLNSSGIDVFLIDYLSGADFAAIENADSASARIAYYSQRMAEWSATIRSVLSEIRQQPRYQSRIGLLGISLGAMPTTTIGVNNPDVAAMALVDRRACPIAEARGAFEISNRRWRAAPEVCSRIRPAKFLPSISPSIAGGTPGAAASGIDAAPGLAAIRNGL